MSTPPVDPDTATFAVQGHAPQAVYVYRDQHGSPAGAVVRFAPGTLKPDDKTFRQFRFEAGAWTSGLNGQVLPLYRLAELLSEVRGSEPVFVVEGEKCVEALRKLGFTATTNAGGAGKWNTAHTQLLRGARVVVIADNDEVGRKHSQSVARELHGETISLRVLDAPAPEGRPADAGWDIADWIEAGGTADQLKLLIAGAVEWSPAAAAPPWDAPVPFASNSEPLPFVVEEMLPPALQELSMAIAESVKVDIVAPSILAPAVLSAAAGNAFSVQVSPSYAEPNLSRYAFWSKPSGERGSETVRRVIRPFDEWMRAEAPNYEEAKKECDADTTYLRKLAEKSEAKAAASKSESEREKLRKEARQARLEIPRPPARPILYIGDTTSEALARLMHEQGGASALISADARHAADEILGRYASEGKTNDSLYLRAHGGDTIDRSRVGADSHGELFQIGHPALAIALCVQPDKLAEVAERSALLSSGFLARCNLAEPRSLVGTRIETGSEQPMEERIVEGWNKLVTELLTVRREHVRTVAEPNWKPIRLVLADEAMAARREFANELERRQGPDGDLRDVSSFASKAAGEAARLAALFHLAELAADGRVADAAEIPVSLVTWRYAEAHQRWQLTESLRVLSLAREDEVSKKARRLLAWCARHAGTARVLASRDVIAARIADDAAAVAELMGWLGERNWVRSVKGPSKSSRWEVHPAVFEAEGRPQTPGSDSATQHGGTP